MCEYGSWQWCNGVFTCTCLHPVRCQMKTRFPFKFDHIFNFILYFLLGFILLHMKKLYYLSHSSSPLELDIWSKKNPIFYLLFNCFNYSKCLVYKMTETNLEPKFISSSFQPNKQNKTFNQTKERKAAYCHIVEAGTREFLPVLSLTVLCSCDQGDKELIWCSKPTFYCSINWIISLMQCSSSTFSHHFMVKIFTHFVVLQKTTDSWQCLHCVSQLLT